MKRHGGGGYIEPRGKQLILLPTKSGYKVTKISKVKWQRNKEPSTQTITKEFLTQLQVDITLSS